MLLLKIKKYLLFFLFCILAIVSKATETKVYVIISEECPICQYMGQELAVINESLGEKVELYLVFPFKNSNIKKASLFKKEFGLSSFKILMDKDQKIAKQLGAKVTPEAIILNDLGEVIYRGRISDTYQAIGRRKHSAGRKDLRVAIYQALNDKPIDKPWPKAIGCLVTYKKSEK